MPNFNRWINWSRRKLYIPWKIQVSSCCLGSRSSLSRKNDSPGRCRRAAAADRATWWMCSSLHTKTVNKYQQPFTLSNPFLFGCFPHGRSFCLKSNNQEMVWYEEIVCVMVPGLWSELTYGRVVFISVSVQIKHKVWIVSSLIIWNKSTTFCMICIKERGSEMFRVHADTTQSLDTVFDVVVQHYLMNFLWDLWANNEQSIICAAWKPSLSQK